MERELQESAQARSQLQIELEEIRSQNQQLQNSLQVEKNSYEQVKSSSLFIYLKDEINA